MTVANNPADVPGDPSQTEARFIAPTTLCPSPHYWHSTDGDSTEIEVSIFIGGLVRALQPDYAIETGSAFGQTSEWIAKALADNGHGFLDTIEPDENRARITKDRLSNVLYSKWCKVNECESLSFTPRWPIDFAFFDSWYELRVPEFRHFRPHMRTGTIACFHDSAPGHGGHRIASGRDLMNEIDHELFGFSTGIRWVNLPTPRGLLMAEVL